MSSRGRCPLPNLKDHASCKHLMDAIQGEESGSKTVSLDDIPEVLHDLETLLLDTIKKKEMANESLKQLALQSKSGKEKKSKAAVKKSRIVDDKSRRGNKSESAAALNKSGPLSMPSGATSARSKMKSSSKNDAEKVDPNTASSSNTTPYDVPKSFWNSIKPYCDPVTPKLANYLEQMANPSPESYKELLEMPELGQDYREQWLSSDQQAQQNENRKLSTGCRPTDDRMPDDAVQDFRKTLGLVRDGDEQEITLGSLTNRIYNVFIDEDDASPNAIPSPSFSNAKQDIRLNLGNADVSSAMRATRVTSKHKFEETVHSELISTGIFDAGMGDSGVDEVQMELAKCQEQLREVMAIKVDICKQLSAAVKKSLRRQQIIQEKRAVEDELIKSYADIVKRGKKRPLLKKEKAELSQRVEKSKRLRLALKELE